MDSSVQSLFLVVVVVEVVGSTWLTNEVCLFPKNLFILREVLKRVSQIVVR